MLFGVVYIAHFTKFANRGPLRLLSRGKFQTEKRPWTEEKKQRKDPFLCWKETKTPF